MMAWFLVGCLYAIQGVPERIEYVADIDDWRAEVLAGTPQAGGLLQGPPLEAGFGKLTTENSRGGMCFLPSGETLLASEGVVFVLLAGRPVRLFAGSPGLLGHQDGPVSTALFGRQLSLAPDGRGGVYVGDRGNRCVRRMHKTSSGWRVETLAGNSEEPEWEGTPRDGKGEAVVFRRLHAPIVADGEGNAYVMDDNFLRRIAPDGLVETLNLKGGSGKAELVHNAGRPEAGDGAPNVDVHEPLESARFSLIMGGGLCFGGDGALYVADRWNHCIRRVDLASRTVSIVVGPGQGYLDGPERACGFHDSPGSIVFDPYRVRFYTNGVDDWGLRVWENGDMKTIAGGGRKNRDLEGAAKDASIHWAAILAVDPRPSHDIYFISGGPVWSHRLGRLTRREEGR